MVDFKKYNFKKRNDHDCDTKAEHGRSARRWVVKKGGETRNSAASGRGINDLMGSSQKEGMRKGQKAESADKGF